MLLCRLDQRAVELLKDQKNVKRSKLCLGHSRWDGSLQWGRAVAGGAGAQSSKVPVRPCGFKGSAVELCWPLGQAPPALQNSCQHFSLLESEQNLNVKIFGGGQ